MKSKLENMLDMIRFELVNRAEKKFPTFPTDPIHAAGIVVEEAGELMKAALQITYEEGNWKDVQAEAVETAAMALRLLVMIDYLETRPSPQC